MRFKVPAVAGLCAVMIVAASAVSALSPEDILRKSNTAEKTVTYRGLKTTILYDSKRVEARMRVTHLKPDRTRTEYLSPKELQGIITIDRGGDNWRYLPRTRQWQHSRWKLGEENLALTLKNYRVVASGSGSVAGRATYIVKVVPKQKGIPSQVVWIDKHYYLVLKSEVRSPNGSLRSASSFSDIDFNPGGISSKLFDPKGSITNTGGKGPLSFNPIKPDYLPKGYVLVGISPVEVNGDISAHLQYTNGINTISIFEKINTRSSKSGDKIQRKPNGVTMITSSKGRLGFTVIGDIDSKELLKVAKSLK